MQDKHLVIVHFKEDRDKMINKLKYPYTVIHKGQDPQPGDVIHENIGKDCYSYLKYIVDNYDNLHEYEIFTQADPDDHVHEFLKAIDTPFTAGYGNLGYARSIYKQYGQVDEVSIPIKQFLRECGIKFINDDNCSKSLYLVNPGCIFYVHRDRIRQRPVEFYKKLMSFVTNDSILKLLLEEDYPLYVHKNLNRMFPHFKHLKGPDKIMAADRLHINQWMNDNGIEGFFGALMESVWSTIFMSIERLEKINKAQAAIGNTLYFNTELEKYDSNFKFFMFPFAPNVHQTVMNFKLLENDAFDWDSEEYKIWRETLIEKTKWEGSQRNFDYLALLDYYRNVGYRHITL